MKNSALKLSLALGLFVVCTSQLSAAKTWKNLQNEDSISNIKMTVAKKISSLNNSATDDHGEEYKAAKIALWKARQEVINNLSDLGLPARVILENVNENSNIAEIKVSSKSIKSNAQKEVRELDEVLVRSFANDFLIPGENEGEKEAGFVFPEENDEDLQRALELSQQAFKGAALGNAGELSEEEAMLLAIALSNADADTADQELLANAFDKSFEDGTEEAQIRSFANHTAIKTGALYTTTRQTIFAQAPAATIEEQNAEYQAVFQADQEREAVLHRREQIEHRLRELCDKKEAFMNDHDNQRLFRVARMQPEAFHELNGKKNAIGFDQMEIEIEELKAELQALNQ